MRIKIEPILKKMDLELSSKSKKDINMLYILIVASIFFLSYYFLFDISENYKQQISHKANNMNAQISSEKQFLHRNSLKLVQALEKQAAQLEDKTDKIINANKYLDYKLSQINYLFYNQQIWGKFINEISQNADKNHIKILDFQNKLADSNDTFGHLLDISISEEGNFINNIKFINFLESRDLVVDVHTLSMQIEKKKLKSDMNISIWGIAQ